MPTLMQRFARLAPYLRSSRAGLFGAAAGAVLGAATEPALPALMKPLLDDGFSAQTLPVWLVPLVIVLLFAVRGTSGFLSQYGLAWSANRAVLQLRRAMFDRLLGAAPALFTGHSASQLTNTLVHEVQGGVQQLVSSLLTLVRDTLTLLALLAYLMWLNWQLTLFVALLFPAMALLMRVIGRRLHRVTIDGQRATDELAYVVEENVLAWRIVRLHGAAGAQASRFFARADRLRRLTMKSVVASSSMTPLSQLLTAVALSSVIAVALWQSGSTGGTVGGFVSFVTAMLMLTGPIKHLSDVMGPITRGMAAVERGLDLIDHSATEPGGTHAPQRAHGDIRFDGVTLRYGSEGLPALNGVTLQLRAGETVALVGPSGAGKSTLVNLLPRFVEPGAGTISLDGVPLPQWELAALRRQFALVSQDLVLFNDSIAANVALGSDMPRATIEAALRSANLWDFVQTLPQGMDSMVGHNGSQLSGGQRQRLAIARAIAKDAPVLILDEATSALDSESERAVQDALDRLMQGRTTLVVAHRLSTIEHADRVVALDAGRVAEVGTHAELLARGGLYARLHAMQFRTEATS